ncbi:MAG: Asp-tRNA(Asn)/Glu-tRNA(Gln) amidotransferase subunit GatA [Candidatus Oxydemutatoraceae bacterium WSBS_2016_MAG_OTU14]
MQDVIKQDLSALHKGLKTKQFSSVELVRFFLERIQRLDTHTNAFITVSGEFALKQAQQADEAIKAGKQGLLTGIPYAHKDIFCTQEVRTTCASKMLEHFVPPYDATVTKKLKTAGMVMLGKTNMDEFAMGSSSETGFFGSVKNPWNTKTVAGGSSGGSAASVAARLAPCATGTDTGGSIRQPASLCGVTGIKPTYGRVSRYGMIAYASSLDQGGVFATSAKDCALMLQAISGFDAKDSTSAEQTLPDFQRSIERDLHGLKLGLPKQYICEGLDPSMRSALEAAIAKFTELGCEVVEVDLPILDLAIPSYYILASAECSSNLARYDGVRYGYRCDDPQSLSDMYVRTRSEGFGNEVKRRIMMGSHVLSTGYYDAYYRKAQKARYKVKQGFAELLKQVDALIAPVSPTPAFGLGEKINDPVQMYLSDIYTVAVNLAGLPALALPNGFAKELPLGMQLIGNYFDEALLFALGHQYQQASDWNRQIPELARNVA